MRLFLGFDDTDIAGVDRGTGKMARWFERDLPQGVRMWGVVRQQLPVLEGIPYTSKNSSACLILEIEDPGLTDQVIERAAKHIDKHFLEDSDPGLCVVAENGSAVEQPMAFGRKASSQIVTQKEAMHSVNGCHLSGHGGTNDGIMINGGIPYFDILRFLVQYSIFPSAPGLNGNAYGSSLVPENDNTSNASRANIRRSIRGG